ncbi:MAG TPA: HAMP domain-containing protein [archaeon]|nr:HAMP domain-containing protein [archaeon]
MKLKYQLLLLVFLPLVFLTAYRVYNYSLLLDGVAGAASLEEARALARESALILYFVAGLVFSFFLLIIAYFYFTLVRSLERITDAMQAISKGDLEGEVPETKRSDEVGELARAFKRMVVSFKLTGRAKYKIKESPFEDN